MTCQVTRESGFTLVELLVSTAITLIVTAAVFTVISPSAAIFQTQPEVADLQQRMRVGVDTLLRDLTMAGAGEYAGAHSGPLIGFLAPVQPRLMGFLPAFDDPPGTVRRDAITLFHVPKTPVQTTLAEALQPTSSEVKVNRVPGCPPGSRCGLEEGMQVLLFDDVGSFDSLTLTRAYDDGGRVQRNGEGPLSKTYGRGSRVVEVRQHTYYLDTAADRLVHYDGYRARSAVLDNVVGLTFEYFGEPAPPILGRSGTDRPTQTGPTHSPAQEVSADWPAGDNCTVTVSAGRHEPRLAPLGAPGSGLVWLTAADFADGPWCPDAVSSSRYDADLLRVRAIRVNLRIQTGNQELRGASGAGVDVLFARPGTSRSDHRLVPDQAISFDVTPRNLNAGR